MNTTKNSSLGKRVLNAVSFFAGLSFFAFVLPVFAVNSLYSLTTTLAQPYFSADYVTDPTYTNVTYAWALSHTFSAGPGDPCMTSNDCFKILLDLQDMAPTTTYQGQEWMGTIVTGDIDWNGPSDMAVSGVQRLDNDSNGRYEQLEILVDCLSPCAMVTSTEYSLTIVNNPIKNPEQPVVYTEGVYATTTHTFTMVDQSTFNLDDETLISIVAIGQGVTVSADVEPSLTFSIEGGEAAAFYGEPGDEVINNSAADDTCDFGTLTPGVAKYCTWTLSIATNAANGYAIYVVQDQDMTFNGNTIKQYDSGTRVDDAVATLWNSPDSAQLAHLGYSSNDPSVFVNSAPAEWAGIPNIASAGQAPVATGLVADSASPGDDAYSYAIKIESAATLPQGSGYTHNEYFIVVGNF